MLSIIKLFRHPTADELAAKQLADAQRALLEAESQAEYYQHMAKYYSQIIARLEQRKVQS